MGAVMIIAGIIQIITLIAFFILVDNVIKIRKQVCFKKRDTDSIQHASYYLGIANMEEYLGNVSTAIENYKKALYCVEKGDHLSNDEGYISTNITNKKTEEIKNKITELEFKK